MTDFARFKGGPVDGKNVGIGVWPPPGPCDELRHCVHVFESGERCAFGPDDDHHGHEFKPHQHSIGCSARFWREVMGCDFYFGDDGVPTYCVVPGAHVAERHFHAPFTSTIVDIIGSPETDEAWLAMLDVLAEAERRDWGFEIVATSGQPAVQFWVPDLPGAVASEPFEIVKELPRAVILAAWTAHRATASIAI